LAFADCGTDYYVETVVKPETVKYGKLKRHIAKTPAVYRERTHPVVTKMMSRETYQKLPQTMVYKREVQVAPVYGPGKPLDYVIDNISDFDFVEYPNGHIVRRPLKDSILARYADDKDTILLSPWRIDWVEETALRPEPIELPNGQLQVVMIPNYTIVLEFPENLYEVEQSYIKSRTPAHIKLTPCHKR